jgi:hypothetical protein
MGCGESTRRSLQPVQQRRRASASCARRRRGATHGEGGETNRLQVELGLSREESNGGATLLEIRARSLRLPFFINQEARDGPRRQPQGRARRGDGAADEHFKQHEPFDLFRLGPHPMAEGLVVKNHGLAALIKLAAVSAPRAFFHRPLPSE